ncbi:MAG: hypothetical protein WCG87_08690 [Bacteroidota bacterium]
MSIKKKSSTRYDLDKNKIQIIPVNSAFNQFLAELNSIKVFSVQITEGIFFVKSIFGFIDRGMCCKAIHLSDPQLYNILLIPKDHTSIELFYFDIFKTGQGLGSYYIGIFDEISKRLGIEILVQPTHLMNNTSRGVRVNQNRVHDFYRMNGFKQKGNSLYWTNK